LEITDLFSGGYLNAVDAKGRVSLPSQFRSRIAARAKKAALAGNEIENPKLLRVARHERYTALEAYDDTYMVQRLKELEARVAAMPDDVDKYEMLEDLRFDALGATSEVTYDDAGRMVLSQGLRQAAGITDLAYFMGGGLSIQIWDPRRLMEERANSPRVIAALQSALADKGIRL